MLDFLVRNWFDFVKVTGRSNKECAPTIETRINHVMIFSQEYSLQKKGVQFYPAGVCHVTEISDKEPQWMESGRKFRARFAVRILRGNRRSRTCVKLYRSSRRGVERTLLREMDAFVVVAGFRAMRMPEGARGAAGQTGRRRMQLRAFNEVSRLAADAARRDATSLARVSFSFEIHYPFDPSLAAALTHLPTLPSISFLFATPGVSGEAPTERRPDFAKGMAAGTSGWRKVTSRGQGAI